MDKLLRTFFSLKDLKIRRDDDFCDRLTRQYTFSMLIISTMLVTTKQFVGDPISCWCPAHFTDSHRQYTNTICWISSKFYLPFEQRIPGTNELAWRERQMISYYQWVPLILLVEAVFAFMPCLLWRFLNIRAGIDLSALMDAAIVCQRASYVEIRDKTSKYMVNQIDRYLLSQREYRRGCCHQARRNAAKYCFLVGGKRHGNYLTVTYLIVKILYLVNAIGQLFLLDQFLGIDYHVYGVQVIARLLQGNHDSPIIERFPRVTLCNFQIRHQGRLHEYVVQCALTINLFNEKVFIIIWFWYVILAIFTLISCIQWIFRALYWKGQIHYVKRNLRAFAVTHRSKANLAKFVQYYLRRDGLFLVRMIALNIGEMVAAETLVGLWENYGPDRRMMSEHPSRTLRPVTVEPTARRHESRMEMV